MKLFPKNTVLVASIMGALAVILGAIGAHALAPHMNEQQLGYYEKAVFYHFIHAIAILIVGVLSNQAAKKQYTLSAIFFLIGVLFFSGSLYLFALQGVIDLGGFKKVLGPITPLGGLSFITGWIFLGLGSRK